MMGVDQIVGWLLGLPNVTTIERMELSLAAPWAGEGNGRLWVVVGVAALFVVAVVYYVRFQTRGSLAARLGLAVGRGLLLSMLLLTLAEPALQLESINRQPPLVYAVFDGTESMAIADPLSPDELEALSQKLAVPDDSGSSQPRTRQEWIQTLLRDASENNVLARLQRETGCRIEPFVFDGRTTSQLRKLNQSDDGPQVDWDQVADQLTTTGQVTALGNVLTDAQQQFGVRNLAAVVMFSDFAQNSGPAPLGRSGSGSATNRLALPLYTVGVGAIEVVDLAVDLQTDPKIRKGDETSIKVRLRQTGLVGRDVTLRVTAYPEDAGTSEAGIVAVGQKTVAITEPEQLVEFPYTPADSGRFRFEVEAEPLEGEVVEQNNLAWREANVIDDYVRLMYVAFEPSWEWRFVKEVFHRDKTVGMQGFRTYLASSDPRVRESNALFLPTLTPQRSEFFTNDVIFLDDMPATALTPRFCEMVREFVGSLGGGLVVIAGPRFGPAELAGTPLADMLPVVLDPELTLRDEQPFRLRRTPQAAGYPFMQLGKTPAENERAWDNLGPLPWYQPVAQVHERAEVLAEHPRDTCRDGRTPQPLVAVRRYGEGEVVYLAFNELWRLRRRYGERYYRDFWSPLIDRLGLSHDLGRRKRFVPRLDRDQYRVEDIVTLTVQAHDENYSPLEADSLDSGSLEAELLVPDASGRGMQSRSISIPFTRSGIFELRLPVYTAGAYQVRIKDPLTGEFTQREFEVTELSAERRSGVRDLQLQNELARQSGGRSYDLTTVHRMVEDMQLKPTDEHVTRNHPLWTTPLWFLILMTLLLGEWLCRKWIRLT